MKLRPEILTHPNIPKPLHGLSPRTILGKKWWDVERRKAYSSQDYRCIVCGVHKTEAKYHNWIEAHEFYEYNYAIGRITFKKLVGLCHSCHNFIHSGRLYIMYSKTDYSYSKMCDILMHGFKILKEHNLKPFFGTALIYLEAVLRNTEEQAIAKLLKKGTITSETFKDTVPWSNWHLELFSKKYYSKFKDYEEWANYYNN